MKSHRGESELTDECLLCHPHGGGEPLFDKRWRCGNLMVGNSLDPQREKPSVDP